MVKRLAIAMAVVLGSTGAAFAQSGAGQSTAAAQQPPAVPAETRPATTTTSGDTGLWFVPTGEVLPAKTWSMSAYRVNFDYQQGFTDATNFPLTFGFGLGDRAEIFGAWSLVRRIDRDLRPIFVPEDSAYGGLVNEYPFVRQGWSGNKVGDFWIGGKVNLMSEADQRPVALAVRAMAKLPFASSDNEGVGTGKMDFAVDGIVSKELNQRVELSGFAGLMFRADPQNVDLSNGLRWGFGAGFPTRKHLKVTAELHGEKYFNDVVTWSGGALAGDDGTIPPALSDLDSPVTGTLGLTYVGNKFFAGAGLNYGFGQGTRSDFNSSFDDVSGDRLGFQLRVGFHPGVRVYVPPPPPPPPPVAPAAPANRPPTVTARCEPCTVEVGKTSTVTADATDPDGDTLTYRWSAPTGTLTNPGSRQTPWTAPMQPGPVQVTVTVSDGKGGTATDSVTIQVVAPAKKEVVFEDVHFDFDRYSLRPEAVRALDEAIKSLQDDPSLRIEIEGHTCNIGTAEYNLALGERRATAVREYLTGRGISADRLRTVSYGEERPKFDNSREETRRLNRRAALVVRVQ